ncbi:MAG: hypothetical protein ABIO92_09755, partial [Chloroflexia bacterium]
HQIGISAGIVAAVQMRKLLPYIPNMYHKLYRQLLIIAQASRPSLHLSRSMWASPEKVDERKTLIYNTGDQVTDA